MPILKTPKSPQDIIKHLKNAGLFIPDENIAEIFFNRFNYYRFKGYCLYFYNNDNPSFKPEVSFHDIVDIIDFDRELSFLIMEAIRYLEIAIRTVINETMTLKHVNAYWYKEEKYFKDNEAHSIFLRKSLDAFRGSHEKFAKHYREKKYRDKIHPPSWVIVEVNTLGVWSRLFKNLQNDDKKSISKKFGLNNKDVFTSWLHALTVLRNTCAHHNRVWNKDFGVVPKILQSLKKNTTTNFIVPHSKRFAPMAMMIHHLMQSVCKEYNWNGKLQNLIINDFQLTRHQQFQMGFYEDWYKKPFWSQ